jgi:hypothetical protein
MFFLESEAFFLLILANSIGSVTVLLRDSYSDKSQMDVKNTRQQYDINIEGSKVKYANEDSKHVKNYKGRR